MTTAPPELSATGTARTEAVPCDACEHPLAGHDATSLRFCRATQASALTRHCICR